VEHLVDTTREVSEVTTARIQGHLRGAVERTYRRDALLAMLR